MGELLGEPEPLGDALGEPLGELLGDVGSFGVCDAPTLGLDTSDRCEPPLSFCPDSTAFNYSFGLSLVLLPLGGGAG